MAVKLRTRLDEAGFDKVKIHMNNAGYLHLGLEWLQKYRETPDAWDCIDYTASNMYDYQNVFTDPDAFDKKLKALKDLSGDRSFISTELCVNDKRYQFPSYRLAFQMGQNYHKNLTIADAVSIAYCWLLLDVEQPRYGWTRTLFVPDRANGFVPVPSSFQLRVYGAYTRRIREGMVRVATKTDHDGLLATAFAGEGGRRTIVLLNRSPNPIRIDVRWPGAKFTEIESVNPYHANQITAVSGKGDQRDAITVGPGTLMTLTNVPLIRLPDGFFERTNR